MPNDARLGLVVGVTLVILVAVLFVRKDATGGASRPGAVTSTTAGPATDLTTNAPPPIPGLPGAPAGAARTAAPRSHTVQEGETLTSVAVRYYGDPAQSSFLYQANRDRIM